MFALPLLALTFAPFAGASSTGDFRADVVVIVDTSTSMRSQGMDPERTSLLVTQLLADIVPGELAVVRLLDLKADRDVLPSAPTGEKVPCREDPTRPCDVVAPTTDWEEEARSKRLGVLTRPARADEGFADALDAHLEQRIGNSMFELAFRAAQGVFEGHLEAGEDLPRTVIWLSDGASDDPASVIAALRRLAEMEVGVTPIVFGRGTTALAERAGLEARRTSSPAELMGAFAGAFRRIVEAPYEIDARVAEQPSFTMQPAVEEAWVVVYGDDGLGEVHIATPGGKRRPADHAQRRLAGAGAYRVAHFERPAAGSYTVEARGGGDVAYAVVQRSSLRPRLAEPAEATAGAETTLVVEVVAGEAGEPVRDEALLAGASLNVFSPDLGIIELQRQDGGRFSGTVQFQKSGDAVLELHLSSPVVESRVEDVLPVTGFFKPRSFEITVDFGSLTLGEERCLPILLDAEHEGAVPLTVSGLRRPPAEHRLVLSLGDADPAWRPDEQRRVSPGEAIEVCLQVGERAPSSSSDGRTWLAIEAPGSEPIQLRLSWQVEGLGFWGRWGWLILTVLGVLLLVFIVLGFVLPHRFSPSLALVFVDDRDEIDEQQPQPVKQWRGVGIGFYRHARAHLHTSFRISGKARGALATLVAESRGARVVPGKGAVLGRETLDGDWEPVSPEGRRVRGGDVYRIGDSGPYFRVAMRGGRDG